MWRHKTITAMSFFLSIWMCYSYVRGVCQGGLLHFYTQGPVVSSSVDSSLPSKCLKFPLSLFFPPGHTLVLFLLPFFSAFLQPSGICRKDTLERTLTYGRRCSSSRLLVSSSFSWTHSSKSSLSFLCLLLDCITFLMSCLAPFGLVPLWAKMFFCKYFQITFFLITYAFSTLAIAHEEVPFVAKCQDGV